MAALQIVLGVGAWHGKSCVCMRLTKARQVQLGSTPPSAWPEQMQKMLNQQSHSEFLRESDRKLHQSQPYQPPPRQPLQHEQQPVPEHSIPGPAYASSVPVPENVPGHTHPSSLPGERQAYGDAQQVDYGGLHQLVKSAHDDGSFVPPPPGGAAHTSAQGEAGGMYTAPAPYDSRKRSAEVRLTSSEPAKS
jgi:hypothetical protein